MIDNHSPDPSTRFWSKLAIARTYRREGSYTAAHAELDAIIGDDSWLLNEDGSLNTGRLTRALFNRADTYRSAADWPNAIFTYQSIADDSRIHPEEQAVALKNKGDVYLWNTEQYLDAIAVYDQVESIGAGLVGNPSILAWSALNRGHAKRRIAGDTPHGSDRTAAIEAAILEYDHVTTTYPADTYGQAALWALVESGQMEIWDGRRRYTEARTRIDAAIAGVGPNEDRSVLAQATFVPGDTYPREGHDLRDNYFADAVPAFETAISYFEMVHPGSFPKVRPDQWYFGQAPARIAEAYTGLGRYAEARSYLAPLITDTVGHSARERASFQLEYANTYREEFWDAERNDLTAEMVALRDRTLAEYALVGSYLDDGGEPVDNGHPWAGALIESAEVDRGLGNHYRHELRDQATAEAYYNTAITTLAQVTTTAFPNIDPGEWYFRRTAELEAEILGELGDYAGARSALVDLRDAAAAAGDYGAAAWAQLDIGRWYFEEAQWTDVYDLTTYDDAAALLAGARTALGLVAGILGSDGSYADGGRPAADAQVMIGRTYVQQADWLQHRSRQDFGTIVPDLENLYATALAAFWVVVGNEDNNITADAHMLAAEDDRFAARAQQELGWVLYNAIMTFYWNGALDKAHENYGLYLGYALEAFRAVEGYTNTEAHDIAQARRGEVRTLIALGGPANLAAADELVWEALYDPAFSDENATHIAVSYAEELVRNRDELLTADPTYAIGGSNDWATNAELLLTTVIDGYGHVDGGHLAAYATEILGELYRAVARHYADAGDTATADARRQDAVDTFTSLSTVGAHLGDFAGIGYHRRAETYIDWAHLARDADDNASAEQRFLAALPSLVIARDSYSHVWDGHMAGDAYYRRGDVRVQRGLIESDPAVADVFFDQAIADFEVARDSYGYEGAQERIDETGAYRSN